MGAWGRIPFHQHHLAPRVFCGTEPSVQGGGNSGERVV